LSKSPNIASFGHELFKIDHRKETKLLQDLCTNCAHLTELNIKGTPFKNGTIQAIVENLTPTILKVSLADQGNLKDEHVKKLVKRCNKITHLDLIFSGITNDSLQSIVQHLNTSLEELDVNGTIVDFDALLQLKSVATLKSLHSLLDVENIKILKIQLPHVRIPDEFLNIAWPNKMVNDFWDFDWIWISEQSDKPCFVKLKNLNLNLNLNLRKNIKMKVFLTEVKANSNQRSFAKDYDKTY